MPRTVFQRVGSGEPEDTVEPEDTAKPEDTAESWMRRALRVAGDTPGGALVIDAGGGELGAGQYRVDCETDPTAHAELQAIRSACATVGDWRLTGCTLVTIMEPCPMCAGAIVAARVSRVVIGCWDDHLGAVSSVWDLLVERGLARRPAVLGGVLADACRAHARAVHRG